MRYSPQLQQHFRSPVGTGRLDDAHGIGLARHPPCGDTTRIYLRIDGRLVVDARFQASGCGPGVACGSVLMTLLLGADVLRAESITAEEIASLLALPKPKIHCAEIAVQALRAAIRDARQKGALPASTEMVP